MENRRSRPARSACEHRRLIRQIIPSHRSPEPGGGAPDVFVGPGPNARVAGVKPRHRSSVKFKEACTGPPNHGGVRQARCPRRRTSSAQPAGEAISSSVDHQKRPPAGNGRHAVLERGIDRLAQCPGADFRPMPEPGNLPEARTRGNRNAFAFGKHHSPTNEHGEARLGAFDCGERLPAFIANACGRERLGMQTTTRSKRSSARRDRANRTGEVCGLTSAGFSICGPFCKIWFMAGSGPYQTSNGASSVPERGSPHDGGTHPFRIDHSGAPAGSLAATCWKNHTHELRSLNQQCGRRCPLLESNTYAARRTCNIWPRDLGLPRRFFR